jgi:hypothetical protein
MVRWFQHYSAASTPVSGADDDGGEEYSSRVDHGDGDDDMDE